MQACAAEQAHGAVWRVHGADTWDRGGQDFQLALRCRCLRLGGGCRVFIPSLQDGGKVSGGLPILDPFGIFYGSKRIFITSISILSDPNVVQCV